MTNEINAEGIAFLKQEIVTCDESSTASAPSVDPLLQSLANENIESMEHPLDRRSSSSLYTFQQLEIVKKTDDDCDTNVRNKNTTAKPVKSTGPLDRFSGIFYAILSSLLFSCTNFGIKQLTTNLMDAMFFRFLGQTLISLIINMYHGYNPFRTERSKETLLYLGNAFVGASNSLFFYLSLSLIPLPDLNTIRYSSVIWTAVIAMIVFHESKLSIPTLIAIVLTLTGVVLVVQPTFLFSKKSPPLASLNMNRRATHELTTGASIPHERYIGLFLALLCAFSISSNIIITKKLFNLYEAKQSVLMFHFSFLTTVAIFLIQVFRRVYYKTNDFDHFSTLQFMVACIVGVLQILPVLCYQRAIKREHPSIVTVAQSSDILFSIVLQNCFTKSKSNWLAILGAAFVLTSIALVGGQKLYQDRHRKPNVDVNVASNGMEQAKE